MVSEYTLEKMIAASVSIVQASEAPCEYEEVEIVVVSEMVVVAAATKLATAASPTNMDGRISDLYESLVYPKKI